MNTEFINNIIQDTHIMILDKENYLSKIENLRHKKMIEREIKILKSFIQICYDYEHEISNLKNAQIEKDTYYLDLHNAVTCIYYNNQNNNLFRYLLFKPQYIMFLFEQEQKEKKQLQLFKNWYKSSPHKDKLTNYYSSIVQTHEQTINSFKIQI